MKKVVYTSLTGNYDALEQHDYVSIDYDYICFSNDFGNLDKVGIWNIKKINYNTDDMQLLSRFPKLQPHEVLRDYNVSLYVDANVNIKSDYVFHKINELIECGVLMAGIKHQERDCIYEEGYKVILNQKDCNYANILKQLSIYKREGFPLHYGMYEANVIYRMHNHSVIINQSNEWWYLRCKYSKRDQLGLSYTLWKCKIPFNYLLPENESARNSQHIKCIDRPWKHSYLVQKCVNFYFKYITPLWQKLTQSLFYNSL